MLAAGGLRILIVDDDEDGRGLVAEILHHQGYSVFQAKNGREALAILERIPRPDLILLDIFMPEMDGFEFRRHQLADERFCGIPVIVMSADPRIDCKRSRTEAAHYFRKPLNMPALLAALSLTTRPDDLGATPRPWQKRPPDAIYGSRSLE